MGHGYLLRRLTLALSGRGQHGGACKRPRTWSGRGTRPLKGVVRQMHDISLLYLAIAHHS